MLQGRLSAGLLGGEEDGDDGNSHDGTSNSQKATTTAKGGDGGRATRSGDCFVSSEDGQSVRIQGRRDGVQVGERGHPRKVFEILGWRGLTKELEL